MGYPQHMVASIQRQLRSIADQTMPITARRRFQNPLSFFNVTAELAFQHGRRSPVSALLFTVPLGKDVSLFKSFVSCHGCRILICIGPSLATKLIARCCQLHLRCSTYRTCTVTSTVSRPKMKPCRPRKRGQLSLSGQRETSPPTAVSFHENCHIRMHSPISA
jgi:hypothetical protein